MASRRAWPGICTLPRVPGSYASWSCVYGERGGGLLHGAAATDRSRREYMTRWSTWRAVASAATAAAAVCACNV